MCTTNAPSLKPLCQIRWTPMTAAIDSVMKNYNALMASLEEASKELVTPADKHVRRWAESQLTFIRIEMVPLINLCCRAAPTNYPSLRHITLDAIKAAPNNYPSERHITLEAIKAAPNN